MGPRCKLLIMPLHSLCSEHENAEEVSKLLAVHIVRVVVAELFKVTDNPEMRKASKHVTGLQQHDCCSASWPSRQALQGAALTTATWQAGNAI